MISSTDIKLSFQRAIYNDADMLFKWINDPETRAQSLSANTINYQDHLNWFSKKIADKNCFLYLANINETLVGMIRFDVNLMNCTISYLVDKIHRGKKYGYYIITDGIKQFMKDSNFKGIINATVKKTNIPSLKIFEKAGFVSNDENDAMVHFKKIINE